MDLKYIELVSVDNLKEELADFYASYENQNQINNDVGSAKEDDNKSVLDELNKLAKNSEETDEIYITDEILVGEDKDVKPGIYDLEIIGGLGNVFGKRSTFQSLPINWAVSDKENSAGYPSSIRIILFNDDILSFRDISKVKFNTISDEVESSNELGIGQFIVGRDISPGEYKLSTNVEMDPQFENLG